MSRRMKRLRRREESESIFLPDLYSTVKENAELPIDLTVTMI